MSTPTQSQPAPQPAAPQPTQQRQQRAPDARPGVAAPPIVVVQGDHDVRAQWVFGVGVALIALNLFTTSEGWQFIQSMVNPKIAAQFIKSGQQLPLVSLVAQLLFVGLMTLIAAIGEEEAQLMLLIEAGIAVLFVLNRYDAILTLWNNIQGAVADAAHKPPQGASGPAVGGTT